MDRELALECLRLAIAADACDPVEVAERFYAFVTGEKEVSAREKLAAVAEALAA